MQDSVYGAVFGLAIVVALLSMPFLGIWPLVACVLGIVMLAAASRR